jgi:hypothetical protein
MSDSISLAVVKAMNLVAPRCGRNEVISAFEEGCELGRRFAKPGPFTVALVPVATLAAELVRVGETDLAWRLRRMADLASADERVELVASCSQIGLRVVAIAVVA